MSNRPGIGAETSWEIASKILQYDAEEIEDVPLSLRNGGKKLPLGRYLRNRVRKQLGREEGAPPEVQKKIQKELRLVRESVWETGESVPKTLTEMDDGKVALMTQRENRRITKL